MTLRRRAVLVFADAIALDLCRRRWPKTSQRLLQTPLFDSSCVGGAHIHLFTSPGFALSSSPAFTVHSQQGSSFGERFENAIEALARLGYDNIVIVGRDCPDLESADILRAFSLLENYRLVLGPDHRGGCYLIAFHASDRAILKNVRWQEGTDSVELQQRFGPESTALLPVKYDLDTLRDVWLLARSGSRWQRIAELLLQTLQSQSVAFEPIWVDSRLLRLRIHWQLPPPESPLSF